VGKGIWKRVRFNNLDIHSMMSICDVVEEEYRLGLYKRIAYICLFILGIFPAYAERDYRYPSSGQVRPHLRAKFRISPEDYEKEGRKFLPLPAKLSSARGLELSGIFEILQKNFSKAKKPLNFLAEHYLQYTRQKLFL
jgi:hypothetical protein